MIRLKLGEIEIETDNGDEAIELICKLRNKIKGIEQPQKTSMPHHKPKAKAEPQAKKKRGRPPKQDREIKKAEKEFEDEPEEDDDDEDDDEGDDE